ncbi:MAG TPA: ABC transporter ATP-binding protein, partial [Methanobacteriaceae archaeon]|nr:ABC transporter ATP-binding protein [Methanobacteriaceae archaeon]
SFLAIIGPNGGGKSTLLRMILGLLTPEEGKVEVFGRDPRKAREYMGYLPQHVSFLHDFPINVEDTVLTGRYHGLFSNYTPGDREAVHQTLEMVDLDGLADRQMGQLSGGQVQRVFLARALVRRPKLLLLDEPMASVDPQMQYSFYQLLEELKEDEHHPGHPRCGGGIRPGGRYRLPQPAPLLPWPGRGCRGGY